MSTDRLQWVTEVADRLEHWSYGNEVVLDREEQDSLQSAVFVLRRLADRITGEDSDHE